MINNTLIPSEFIRLLRESFAGSKEVYTQGSCYQLYLILKSIFINSECWYDIVEGHVYTKIDEVFYDIYGVLDSELIKINLIKITDEPNIANAAPSWMWSLDTFRKNIKDRCVASIVNNTEL